MNIDEWCPGRDSNPQTLAGAATSRR